MTARAERGFSLIEVVIALGLLAGVLISVAGLFIIGGKQVKSGRTSSEALALAREIQEEMNGWGYSQNWVMFGYDGTANNYTIDTRSNTACTAWQNTLRSKLGGSAYGIIKLESVPNAANVTTNFATAAGVILSKTTRVSVTVNWTEIPGRARSVTVGTTKN